MSFLYLQQSVYFGELLQRSSSGLSVDALMQKSWATKEFTSGMLMVQESFLINKVKGWVIMGHLLYSALCTKSQNDTS